MEAISIRLEQLEHIETALYSLRQATIQRRSQEDNELQSKRRIEDGDYLQQLADHDREEDVSGVLWFEYCGYTEDGPQEFTPGE